VVVTYALCTIRDPVAALNEARRTLAPGGELLFAEHGRSPDPAVRRWQERVTPVWRHVAGGCRLDRDPLAILAEAGFRVQEIDTGYLPGWKPASWHYLGVAVPA
jgi:ubiquinone/menaquinone biosynthesis C-methylase UbiE